MKNNMKKVLSVLLTLAMVLSMSIVAMADTTNYTITAPSNGHTYEIYQIFTGDLSGTTLSNIKAGSNYKGSDAAADAKTLAGVTGTDAEKLAEITKYVDLTKDPAYTVASGANVSVPAGYYLIKDVDGSQKDKDDAYTLYLAKIVGDTTISPKTGTPTVQKKVKDTNDSVADSTTSWQDSADYDINDDIPYQITATMGDLSAYNHYYVEFTDTMSAGLTYKEITSVKVGDTTLTASQYTATWKDQVLTVVINDVKALGATTGTKVVVEYTATLNDKAVIGSAGNPNTVYLTYTNNPNNTGDGTKKPDDTGKTPEDKNIVFTYKVVANKITEDEKALVGASFKLEKLDKDGNVIKDLGTIDGTNASTFTWTGIDDGKYKITEIVTPAGYNSIDPITFTVSATHDTEAANPTLTSLTGGDLFTGDVSTGAVSANIVNYAGSTLPTTGGIGTTIFYVLGTILVLGAGVVLVARKRIAR